jgi:hypothetical protein
VRALLPALALALAVGGLSPVRAAAQEEPRLAEFVAAVARLWGAGDAEGLVALAPAGGRILLDLGEGSASEVRPRNAAAALRRLFGERETVGVRPTRATVSGGAPLRGFGELSWSARPRGVTDVQASTVFLGVVREEGGWRIRELRLLR